MIYDGEKGDIINQYVTFTKIFDEQVKRHGRTREAVLEIIRICKDQNVLPEYLGNRKKEVVSMMTTLFDQEYALARYLEEGKREGLEEGWKAGREKGQEEGEKKGLEKGKLQKTRDIVCSLGRMGMPAEKIAEAAEVSVPMVREWLSVNGQMTR